LTIAFRTAIRARSCTEPGTRGRPPRPVAARTWLLRGPETAPGEDRGLGVLAHRGSSSKVVLKTICRRPAGLAEPPHHQVQLQAPRNRHPAQPVQPLNWEAQLCGEQCSAVRNGCRAKNPQTLTTDRSPAHPPRWHDGLHPHHVRSEVSTGQLPRAHFRVVGEQVRVISQPNADCAQLGPDLVQVARDQRAGVRVDGEPGRRRVICTRAPGSPAAGSPGPSRAACRA
jgi:hypothetical protein